MSPNLIGDIFWQRISNMNYDSEEAVGGGADRDTRVRVRFPSHEILHLGRN